MVQKSTAKAILDGSLILAISSGSLYFCAYGYEITKLKTYHIPVYLFEITIPVILNFAANVLMIMVPCLAIIITAVKKFSVKFDYFNGDVTPKIFVSTFLFIIFELLVFGTLCYLKPGLLSFANALPLFTVFPTIIFIIIRSFYNRPKETGDLWVPFPKEHQQFFNFSLYAFIFAGLFLISEIAGRMDAQNEDTYYVLPNKNVAIFSFNNQLLIAKPYNPKTHLVSDSLILIKLSDQLSTTIMRKKIGSLH